MRKQAVFSIFTQSTSTIINSFFTKIYIKLCHIKNYFLNILFEYIQIIPKETSASMKVNTKEIINILERMSLLINDAVKVSVRISLMSGKIIFNCETALGRATETYETGVDSPEFEIGFNAQYLIEALKATESDEVYINFNSPRQPILITPAEGDSFMYIVMPMQL